MEYATATFVYNEMVNLPVWINYYGKLFGHKNLFIIDRGSDDGSTDNLGDVNIIRIPRGSFDEDSKTLMMSSFHSMLTAVFDAVIMTDCDEILVPDPESFEDLCAYIDHMEVDHVNAVGVDVVHMITDEGPLDFSKPILSQRRFGYFHATACKPLLSRVPIRWLPGLHSSNKAPNFDPRLINFHIKLMDYGAAMKRQEINISTIWSEESLKFNYGAHHRWPLTEFVQQCFLEPIDLKNRNCISEFEFSSEIRQLEAGTIVDPMGNYRVPMNISKMVYIPERFFNIF